MTVRSIADLLRIQLVAVAMVANVAVAGVDPDCVDEEPFICDKSQVERLSEIDQVLGPVVERAGWSPSCVQVLLTKPDKSGHRMLAVEVRGARGSSKATCRELSEVNRRGGASAQELRQIGSDLRAALKGLGPAKNDKLLADVLIIKLGNNEGVEAKIRVSN